MPSRPRLTPAVADLRRAVRASLADLAPLAPVPPAVRNAGDPTPPTGVRGDVVADSGESPAFRAGTARTAGTAERAPLVLVALSGGPDSLALAAGVAFEASRAGIAAGAVVIDHGLQPGSEAVAARAAQQAAALGLAPVRVERVRVGTAGGPEAAARDARYAALERVAREEDAAAVLLGHTLDDQAETVLLGLARGSGAASLQGMAPVAGLWRRPLLGIRRSTTAQACADAGLEPWRDPHNDDPAFARVRVRTTVLPLLEAELGPGVTDALARTAEQLREDNAALDAFAEEVAEDLADHAEAGLTLPAAALAANPPALRQRLVRLAVRSEFGVALSRAQTLEVCRLVTDWHGQAGVDLPGVRVVRRGALLHFESRPDPRQEED
ncbi:tRNA lysidine(34) synthetase TilS [Pseudolysinimonas sp.]|uniref:tRNA lysidine(34) synthetase TilS n=1 Tax=Pseudolysinimonas sp. TaxID=2680009 RepID=UPI003F7E59A0